MDCPNSNERLFGGATVLMVADGCPDAVPDEGNFMVLAPGTSKGWDLSPNTVTSDADDGGGFVETIVTNADLSISFTGEVRKNDALDQYGILRFISTMTEALAAKQQPGKWVRLIYGPITIQAWMIITALSSDGGTNDIVTFDTTFNVGASKTVRIYSSNGIPVEGVSVNPTSANLTPGQSTTFNVVFDPDDATIKDFSINVLNDSRADAVADGLAVTVTGKEGATTGPAYVDIKTKDGSFTARFTANVTAAQALKAEKGK